MLAPTVAGAQTAQDKVDAEVLFNAGKAALGAGKYAEACPKLAESQRRDPAIGTALYLAECYERSGKIASAWAQFRVAEDMAKQRADARATIAKTRADRLSPSKLTVTLAAGADLPGLEVRRDGETLSSVQLGLPSFIDGGRHVVTATAANHKRFEWSGDVPGQGGAINVTIPKLDDAVSPTPPVTNPEVREPVAPETKPEQKPETKPVEQPTGDGGLGGGKIAGLVIAGVGVVALGVGTTMGIVAKSNYDGTANAPYGCVDAGCPTQQGVDARNSAKGLADASTGIFVGGAALAVVGVVLFFVVPRPKSGHALLATPFGIVGRF